MMLPCPIVDGEVIEVPDDLTGHTWEVGVTLVMHVRQEHGAEVLTKWLTHLRPDGDASAH